MIPKKIHYIWLGDKPLDLTSRICINSWRRICPDYEIILWNEQNLDIEGLKRGNAFFRACVERKLWAFAADYLRLKILYDEGGIYLDTDVEVIKRLDGFLESSFFVGWESPEFIAAGVIGAEAGSKVLERLLEFYDREIWDANYCNIPVIFTNLIQNEPDVFREIAVYPSEYFYPYQPGAPCTKLVETDNTVCIHWYNGNWGMSRKGYVFLQTKHVKNPVLRFFLSLKKTVGYYRHRKRMPE